MTYKIHFLFYFVIFLVITSCKDKSQEKIKINANTTLFISDNEPEPLKRAVIDLANDFKQVFGEEVEVVHQLGKCSKNSIIITLNNNLPQKVEKPVGWEKLMITSIYKPFENFPIQAAVLITGSDLRGAIYAVYHFSEIFLGFDPLYWWTGKLPERKNSMQISQSLLIEEGPPSIRFRGLFINDEDLLSGWKPGTWFINGIDPEVWDRIFETILRMKGNMVIPGTFIFPYEPQVKAAGDRGLIITQHHVEVLGLNVYRWPDDIPYSFQNHKEKLISAWTNAVLQYPNDQEILWTVGYRGRHDRAFWDDEKNSPSSKQARANIIKEAILTQTQIVQKYHNDPYFIMNTWGEGIDLIHEGYLNIPNDVTLIWADRGWGIIRDDGAMGQGQGVYYHVAMFNHKCNQLTEMVPISRIQKEIGRAVKSNATEYLLVNTSDFRPVVMSAKAALSVAWDASKWLNDPEYHKVFIREWCENQFGFTVVDEVSKIYERYYKIPAQYADDEHFKMGDNFYTRMAKLYLRRMETEDSTTYMEKINFTKSTEENAQMIIELCQQAEPGWNNLWTDAKDLLADIPANRKDFYHTHILMPIEIHLHANRMLIEVMESYLVSDIASKISHLDIAQKNIEQVLTSLKRAEYGKWKNFYQNDFMTGFRGTRKCIQLTKSKYMGKSTKQNISDYINDWDLWDIVKAYQGNQRVSMH